MTELIAKYLSGNASELEKEEVERWRNENQQNAAALFEWSALWYRAGQHEGNPQSAWDKVKSRIGDAPTKKSGGGHNFAYWKVAAAILIVLGIGWLVFDTQPTEQLQLVDGQYILTTSSGEVREQELPDGSIVTLNENSRLVYPETFQGESRTVEATGIAFFEVEANPEQPFQVTTENSTVEVLGTSFMVDSKVGDGVTEVIVNTGKVALIKLPEPGKRPVSIELLPGESGLVRNTSQGIIKRKNRDKNFMAWKTRMMDFEGERLEEVFETLSDVYKIEIEAENEAILDCRLSAKFQDRSVEAVMEIIGNTFGLQYDINRSTIEVSGEGC